MNFEFKLATMNDLDKKFNYKIAGEVKFRKGTFNCYEKSIINSN
ncbi:hypothetical protein [Clostridium sp.]